MPKLKLILDDPWLEPQEEEINNRFLRFKEIKNQIDSRFQNLENFSERYNQLGFNFENGRYVYREWAPEAHRLELVGDFNNWDGTYHSLTKTENGIWELFFDPCEYFEDHSLSRCKVRVYAANGVMDRLPAYTKETFQDPSDYSYSAVIRKERKPYNWKNNKGPKITTPVIYECHVGMALEDEKVGSFEEFTEIVLPRIKKLGYNTIQLMAIQEHPYYASFGYHVSNFYAVSSRFGSADELKKLIDKAHELGIAVVMDIVHSHAIKNWAEGLGNFDGSGHQYFHEEPRRFHPQWDSLLFDYGKEEVIRFLLSNVSYWLKEFKFDGFRFDGVTSMLYFHHGIETFDNYDKYFKYGVEWDAITYLQLATTLAKEINPDCLLIAEDMSGMPGLCRPVEEGGIGFDYRLGMGIPDYWIKILKEQKDEEWDLRQLWGMLNNRRFGEKTIAYAESHDQSLVGDKTLAFWLMDKHMYYDMSLEIENPIIDRGIAIHKIIRLITSTCGGEGYLTFMGNEFGHPEWIDFPREGNDWSFAHCRRQWNLADAEYLKYKYLNAFEKDLVEFIKKDDFLNSVAAQSLYIDQDRKTIIYERFNFIFVINLHSTESYFDYEIPVNQHGKFKLCLNSDDSSFGGFNRINLDAEYFSYGEKPQIKIYSPSRTALVFKNEG